MKKLLLINCTACLKIDWALYSTINVLNYIWGAKIIMLYYVQAGALVEELNRVSAENRKLTEMLTVMCENYNALRSQLMDYMSRNPEKELSPSRKRKSESSNNINNNANGINGNSESSSTDDESCKKPREGTIKAKISRSYVKTEASDTSLVSYLLT